MLFSVKHAFERKRQELFQVAKDHTSLASSETVFHSKQLDHFINLFQREKPSSLNISERMEGPKLTLTLKGQLDIISSAELTSFFSTRKEKWAQIKELYIDIIELHFFDTSGIQSLILLILEAKKANISIQTISTNPTAYSVLKMMKIPDTLEKTKCGTLIAV